MFDNSLCRSILVCIVLCELSTYLPIYGDNCCIAQSSVETAIDCDSVSVLQPTVRVAEDKGFKAKDLILPGSLITVGSVGIACPGINNTVKRGMDKMRGSNYFRADDYVQFLPVVAYAGLGLVGVKSRHSFKERLVVGLTSYIVMAAMVNGVKYTVHEKRPDSSARNSFPSGHTATVFTGAELVRMEYGIGIGIAAYTIATGVAFLRLYNGRHWLNDVVAGAGIGILSARIGYWMLPLYRKWFRWDKKAGNPVVGFSPSYNVEDRALSFNLAILF